MKSWILWSYSRGSFQYDVLCALILIAIFAIPPGLFNDRPDYMRIPEAGRVKPSVDGDQNVVYTVKVNMDLADVSRPSLREEALVALGEYLALEDAPEAYRVETITNTRGSVVAFAFWTK